MAFEDLDHDIDGVPHFQNVARDWLSDFGRIALLSGRIEFAAYGIAHFLGISRPKGGRTPNIGKECDDIRARLNDPWLPHVVQQLRAGSWRQDTLEWAETVPALLDIHRNGLFHRHYATQKRAGGEWATVTHPDYRDLTRVVDLTRDVLRDAIVALRPVANRGLSLWLQSQPKA